MLNATAIVERIIEAIAIIKFLRIAMSSGRVVTIVSAKLLAGQGSSEVVCRLVVVSMASMTWVENT
jgi:hypothetical protein